MDEPKFNKFNMKSKDNKSIIESNNKKSRYIVKDADYEDKVSPINIEDDKSSDEIQLSRSDDHNASAACL